MLVLCFIEGYARWKHILPLVFEKGIVTMKMPICDNINIILRLKTSYLIKYNKKYRNMHL